MAKKYSDSIEEIYGSPLVLVTLITYILLSLVIFSIFDKISNPIYVKAYLDTGAINILMLSFFVLVFPFGKMFGNKIRRKILAISIVLGFFTLALSIVTTSLGLSINPLLPAWVSKIYEYEEAFNSIFEVPGMLFAILYLIVLSILVPVFEEVLFRGLILYRLKLFLSARISIIVSSVLFGILHVDFFGAFIFGVAVAYITIGTKSLLPAIIIHITNNFIAITIPPSMENVLFVKQYDTFLLSFLGIFFMCIIFFLVWKARKLTAISQRQQPIN